MPFFPEGGRYTLEDVHYVASGGVLVPAGETEFARDKSFGYRSSNLREWISEKHGGSLGADQVRSISVRLLRSGDTAPILRELEALRDFGKLIVNAAEYSDLETFAEALIQALRQGKRYLFRSAAALPKVLGGVLDKPLLTREELVNTENRNGGLIIIGSHVNRTTRQLERLRQASFIDFIEFDQHLALNEQALEGERRRVVDLAQQAIGKGRTVAVFTRRDRLDLGGTDRDAELRLAVRISDALSGIVSSLRVRPRTSSSQGRDHLQRRGHQGLGVRRALVMGQILRACRSGSHGPESRFLAFLTSFSPAMSGMTTVCWTRS